MKTILNLKRSVFFIAALTTVVSFTSCSDDDDPAPSVTDVYGSYKGKVAVTAPVANRATEDSEAPSIDVNATVKSDTIYFTDSPIEDILSAIEGEGAEAVLETMDEVDFKVGYTGKLNQAQDSIAMKLDPKPLQFIYKVGEGEDEITKNVKVTVGIPEDEKSAYSGRILKFKLVASEILVNEEALESFDALYYNFTLNKQ